MTESLSMKHSNKQVPIVQNSRTYFRALGKRITSLRKSIGMTQAELARAIGVSQQSMFAYELGDRRTSVFVLHMLATVFELSLDQIAGRAIIPKKNHRVSPKQLRNAERLRRLSKTAQRFVVRIIDVLEDTGYSVGDEKPHANTP